MLKMALDYILAIVSVILLIPVFLLIALLVKVTSPRGPIIHKRRVMGLNGRKFYALKFRTMHENGEEILNQHPELKEELARTHKLKNDPRVTWIGNFLRKISFDEHVACGPAHDLAGRSGHV